jgi:hypothetical protein
MQNVVSDSRQFGKLLEYILDFLLLPSRPVLSLCDTFDIAAGGINPRA